MRFFTVFKSQFLTPFVVFQAMQLRNKLLKRYFSAEQAVSTTNEDILRELLCSMKCTVLKCLLFYLDYIILIHSLLIMLY